MGHGHGADLLVKHQAAVHDIPYIIIRTAVQISVVLLVKLKVLPQNPVVKAEVKCLRGIGLRVEPQNHLRLIDIQQCLRRQIQPRGTGHLARGPLDADKFIALENRRFIIEYLLRDDLAGVVASPGAGMVFSARLEIHLLIFPAHGPVNLPRQLTVEILCEIMLSLMAALADIVCFRAVIGKRGNLRGVPVAFRTVD